MIRPLDEVMTPLRALQGFIAKLVSLSKVGATFSADSLQLASIRQETKGMRVQEERTQRRMEARRSNGPGIWSLLYGTQFPHLTMRR